MEAANYKPNLVTIIELFHPTCQTAILRKQGAHKSAPDGVLQRAAGKCDVPGVHSHVALSLEGGVQGKPA